MTNEQFALGGIAAVGVVLLASEISPEIVNGLLLLILVGMILSRWAEIAPWLGLAGRVAGGEGPK